MILGLGGLEIVAVLAIALLLFGPSKLPKLGSALGKTVKNLREGMEGEDEEKDEDTEEDEDGEDEEPVSKKSKKSE